MRRAIRRWDDAFVRRMMGGHDTDYLNVSENIRAFEKSNKQGKHKEIEEQEETSTKLKLNDTSLMLAN